MKITLLGTGGPRPDPNRHGPAAIVNIGDAYLLFDAGRGVVLQMVRAGIPLDRVGSSQSRHLSGLTSLHIFRPSQGQPGLANLIITIE